MQIIKDNTPFAGETGTAVALGYFDGVHLGHRAVINAMLAVAGRLGAAPAVFTFALEAKNGQGTGGGKQGKRLEGDAQKHHQLEALGATLCYEPPFAMFSSLSPEDFFEKLLLGQYKARAVVCGKNFGFGKGRAGNVKTLAALCEKADVALVVVPTTLWQGEPVSSSRIRAALADGDIEAVNAMLGYPYEVCLPVEHGRGIGRTMGFPTINQKLPGWMQPPAFGVYITKTCVDGREYPSATGYGTRPTVAGKHATCETFIPGFEGDLYGRDIRVQFYKKIAESQRFAGKEELGAAVLGWAESAKEFFGEKLEVQGGKSL